MHPRLIARINSLFRIIAIYQMQMISPQQRRIPQQQPAIIGLYQTRFMTKVIHLLLRLIPITPILIPRALAIPEMRLSQEL